ncbi:alpha/beta fold hydrolase [Chachezhania antarctica]|uniref:alpha/beta fold hydrolase n=1 Tax=Chachezhania antarctica TaxID=2340860 RepID=UPI000EAEE3EA|nr:alpha/beta hydrolase [Chachezhania antarctica]|tara:strand:- start:2825 stop:3655 length:831 start_codon:yes stop_codon:yes gene_type:complete
MAEFTTSDGLRLYYETRGEGAPILCLPGLTRNVRDFDFVAPHLDGYRMIALDLRGRGLSAHDPDYMTYNIFREGEDVVDLLDHLGLDRATFLGTSRGGLVTMAVAASRPERLAGAILNDVGPEVGPAGIARIMGYLGATPEEPTHDAWARAAMEANAPEFPGVPLSVWRQQAEAQFIETGDGLALRYDPHLRTAILEQAAAGDAPDLWQFFDNLRGIPTGVIRGANSDILTPETLAKMRERRPDLMVAEVPDRGHPPFLDERESLSMIRAVLEAAT